MILVTDDVVCIRHSSRLHWAMTLNTTCMMAIVKGEGVSKKLIFIHRGEGGVKEKLTISH